MTETSLKNYEVTIQAGRSEWLVYFLSGKAGFIQGFLRDPENMVHEIPLLIDYPEVERAYPILKSLIFEDHCPSSYVIQVITGCLRTCMRPPVH